MRVKCTFFFKRFFDVTLSALALILLSPFMLAVCAVIKLDSPGPAFFTQDRLGKDGRVFKLYKFRSMVQGAQDMPGGLYCYTGDRRITKVGSWLRTSSVDELPQLWNVLKGDMSLFGPRPAVVNELGDYATLNHRFKKRFSVRPGISGLAQTHGRNAIDWSSKVDCDNAYIDQLYTKGLWIDVALFFCTVAYVFTHRGINETNTHPEIDAEQIAREEEAELIRIAHLPDEPIGGMSACARE